MKNKKFQYVIYGEGVASSILGRSISKKGFLLIEVMAALAALAGISIVIARYHVYTIHQAQEVQSYLQATNIGCTILEKNGTDQKTHDSFHVDYIVQNLQIPLQFKEKGLSAEQLKKLKNVQVTVSWASPQGQQKQIFLESVTFDDLEGW